MSIKDLTNRDEVLEKLTEMLLEIDEEHPQYQIDIYLYIDENGHGELAQFENVGGNGWLDDDHIRLGHAHYYCDTLEKAYYNDVEDLCRGAGITPEELRQQIFRDDDDDDDDDYEELDFYEAAEYIEEHYHDEIVEDYISWRDESFAKEQAEEMLDSAEERERLAAWEEQLYDDARRHD